MQIQRSKKLVQNLNVMDQVQMQAFVPNELIRHQTGIALNPNPRQGLLQETTRNNS